MERKSQVQIPKDLLLALFQYHLAGNEEYLPEIEKALMEKLDSMVKRQLYTTFKTAPTEEEREKARKAEPEQPKMTRLASKYPKLFKVNKELEEQNSAIQKKQKQLSAKKKELSEVKGWFKGRKKKELQNEIDELKSQIRDMKDYLPRIVQKIGYRSVQEFLKDFKASQTEYSQYRTAIEKWKKETGKEPVAHSIRAKLAEKKQEIQNEQKNKQHTRSQNKDRGAR